VSEYARHGKIFAFAFGRDFIDRPWRSQEELE